jgi:subfamily B ATP-binding cassette protein MsbA
MALFTVISIPLIIPFFQVLFSRTPMMTSVPESKWDIIAWLEYFFVQVLETYGTDKAILMVCGAIAFTFLLKNLFRYLAMFFMVPVRSNIVRDLRYQLYTQYINYNFIQDQEHNKGDLISRITADVQEVEWSILRFIEIIFKSPIVIIGSITLMFSINVKLTMFVFVLMLFTGVVIGTLSKTLKKQSVALQDCLAKMTSSVDEGIDGAMMINVYQTDSYWQEKFSVINNTYRRLLNKVSWRQDLSSPLSEFMGVSVVVVLLWYGSHLVLNSELKPETFFAFIFAFYNVIEPSKSFSSAFYNIKKGIAAFERIDNVLSINSYNSDRITNGEKMSFKREIRFENVSFSYDDMKVLDNLSFTINACEKIALVGPSGAGKSTIKKLLLGYLKPDSGTIYVDGVDLSNVSMADWYQQLGIVSQKAFLYNDTVRNNVTLGRDGITDDQIWEAMKECFAYNFVQDMPLKLDTVVGDSGEMISGGEQQRLTIARALVANPSILIFDEPTSALDAESETKVSQAINNALEKRTAIVIAHRISTIKKMDRILVLDKGRVIESGNHNALVDKKGVYADYVSLQSIS